MKLKTALAWIGIFAISFIPAYLLLAFGPRNFSSIPFVLGQIAGLIGMTMFALTFILSTRAKWIEDLFDGQDKVYVVHGVLGATSLITLLFHPILLVSKYLPGNFDLAARYLLPGGLFSIDLGIYALLGMIILIALTLYSTMRYHTWKISHEFFGLVFIIAVLHVMLIDGTGSRDYIFHGYKAFAIIVSGIGIGGFFYSFVIRKIIKSKEYRIDKVVATGQFTEVHMTPVRDALDYKAGQFIFVKFYNKKVGSESHPFSIASKSADKSIVIIMKSLGDYTKRTHNLQIGDRVKIEGPYGTFHQNAGFEDEVWIAGGIGITPFIGLAKEFEHTKTGHVDLFYCVKNQDELLYIYELKRIEKSNSRFRLHIWTSETQGRMTLQNIQKECPNIDKKRYYMCGPESLKQSIKDELRLKDITSYHDERFAFK